MDSLPLPDGFPISGVAPEASLYPYRVFSCRAIGTSGRGGTNDIVMKAMERALVDKVDILSMSLSLSNGQVTPIPQKNPIEAVAKRLYDAGIAIIVAMGNDGGEGVYAPQLYTQTLPSELSTVISVGSVANAKFPLVYNTEDSTGAALHYGTVNPISTSSATGLDVYVIEGNGCDKNAWDEAVAYVEANGNLNTTILAYHVDANCRPASASTACCSQAVPPYVLGIYDEPTNPYYADYEAVTYGRFNSGRTKVATMIRPDSATLLANYEAAGGYKKYQLKFTDTSYFSPPQLVGGKMDYFSGYGPVRHTYEMKPQISAPGGHILSTFPISQGSYGILSGTSMATPYLAGCYALIKSKFPDLSIKQILALLQTNANPMIWPHDDAVLSTPAQQGAGLVNVYHAISSQTRVSPGQLLVTDNNRTTFGVVEITLENKGTAAQTYTLGHRGAGYTETVGSRVEKAQRAKYGTAKFSTPTFDLAPGASTQISVSITPPTDVNKDAYPVFGGYIDITPSGGANLSVPYLGPAYSLYNADQLVYDPATAESPGSPFIVYTDPTTKERVYDIGLLQVNASMPFTSSIVRHQWVTGWRVDILPADTTLPARYHGGNLTIPPDYVFQAPSKPPTASLFGVPSFGNIWSITTLEQPGTRLSPSGTGMTVNDDKGVTITLAPGDYQWYVSVLRWGGEVGRLEDYDTWLGPILRLVDGPV
jgi:hypothetical protein